MTVTTSTHPEGKKPSARPSIWRVLAGKYVDVLICGFVTWILCDSVGFQSYWPFACVALFTAEFFWCRDRLKPTAGEFCVGIRNLTSSSNQVVTGIQIIPEKLGLNGWLVLGGVVELTLSILFFSGWTLTGKAFFLGQAVEGPVSLAYWLGFGFAFFLCSGYLLNGCRHSIWFIPAVHLGIGLDFYKSAPRWAELWATESAPLPVATLLKTPSFHCVEWFAAWSVILVLILLFSRKNLVN